jgi:cobaltochelatase CobS
MLEPVELNAEKVFGVNFAGQTIRGYNSACQFTPIPDPFYLFQEQSEEIAAWYLESYEPIYIFGPTGSGKTSLVKEISAKLNYPVFEVTGHNRLEFPDLAGHLTVTDGNMSFQYGPLALAMKFGGLFLLNEIDLLDPSTVSGLNSVLDGSPLCIPENGGELIVPNPMFRLAATANTNGGIDESGLYQGTLRQNIAFMDRFWLCEINYPKPELEIELLAKITPLLPEILRLKMVEFAGEVRSLFMGTAKKSYTKTVLEVTFSTRTLIRWARLTVKFMPLLAQGTSPVRHALDRALAFRASAESRSFLHELSQRIFPKEYWL